jgi:hypothetical protein
MRIVSLKEWTFLNRVNDYKIAKLQDCKSQSRKKMKVKQEGKQGRTACQRQADRIIMDQCIVMKR